MYLLVSMAVEVKDDFDWTDLNACLDPAAFEKIIQSAAKDQGRELLQMGEVNVKKLPIAFKFEAHVPYTPDQLTS